jgi:hypothetical protein
MKNHKIISPLMFGIIIICFLLPFLAISCDKERIVTFTGIQLMTGKDISMDYEEINSKINQRSGSEPLVILAFLCAIGGLVLGFVNIDKKLILTTIAGALGFIFLLSFMLKTDNSLSKEGMGVLSADFLVGYWLSFLLFMGSAGFSGYCYAKARGLPQMAVKHGIIPDTNALYCQNCGSPLRADSKFCSKCGAQISPGEFGSDQDSTITNPAIEREPIKIPKWLITVVPAIIAMGVLAWGLYNFIPRPTKIEIKTEILTENQGYFQKPVDFIKLTVKNISKKNININSNADTYTSIFNQPSKAKKKPVKKSDKNYVVTAQMHNIGRNAWEDLPANEIQIKSENWSGNKAQSMGPNGQIEYFIGRNNNRIFYGCDQMCIIVANETKKDRAELIVTIPPNLQNPPQPTSPW